MMAVALLLSMAVADPAASQSDPRPHRICRKIVPTGTMLARSFCLTAAEWKQFDAENEANHGRNRTTMAKALPTAD